ncbi:MAG TPA: hypothetical protein VGL86_24330 [Polyangia bacterium]|jgi:hypothetical protein
MRSFSLVLTLSFVALACHHSTNGDHGADMSAGSGDGGSDDMSLGGAGGCSTGGATCAVDGDCCSNVCDPTMHVCALGACQAAGSSCANNGDCCTLNCTGGSCGSAQCVSDGQSCTAGGDACCSTQCVSGSCKPLNSTCKTAGNTCGGNNDCCSGDCTGGTCAPPSTVSFCTQLGDVCFHDAECCTGVCTIASGATAGTCSSITTSCRVDGLTCDGCTGCCSSYCAPYGTSSVKVCQPASGCHVLGDLCIKTSDCCGGDAPSGLPGAGLVKCTPDPDHPSIGTCSMANPNNCPNGEPTCKNTCQPEGDVCHYLGNGGCSSNSFPNNCCGATGNKGACQLDKLGVPRCYGIAACVMMGGSCASSADCCNGEPCVPDGTGHLHCGAMSCVPTSGACTTTADCCAGGLCSIPPGSTMGSCVAPTPSGDMMSACAFAGQACTTSLPCCANNGTCDGPTGTACAAGETDCFCSLPIQ